MTATPGPSREGGTRVHRLQLPLLPGWKTVRDRRALEMLERLFAREKYDVVHGHSLYSPLAHAAAFVASKLGIGSVLTNHSLLRRANTLLLCALDYSCMWSTWPTVLTAVSMAAAEDTRRAALGREVLLLGNGIDLEGWTRRAQIVSSPRVTSVMRLCPRKRPLDLIRAIPRVLEQLPQALWPQFTIIGDGPMRSEIEMEAERLGVRAFVQFMGLRSREEIKEVLARTTVFALPSSKEAFGIAALEARCAGVPVVAMGRSGVNDVIEHGREGLLADNPEEFAKHIATIIQDRGLRSRMADRARSRLDRFGWEQVIARHLQVYRLAMDRTHPERDAAPLAAMPLKRISRG